jgi:hypothetical protein
MEILTLSNLMIYLMIGVIFTFFTDQFIRSTLFIEPFTAGETIASILLWPFILYQLIKGFINGEY